MVGILEEERFSGDRYANLFWSDLLAEACNWQVWRALGTGAEHSQHNSVHHLFLPYLVARMGNVRNVLVSGVPRIREATRAGFAKNHETKLTCELVDHNGESMSAYRGPRIPTSPPLTLQI